MAQELLLESIVRRRNAYTTQLLWLLAILLTVLCAFSGGVTIHPRKGSDSSLNAARESPMGTSGEGRQSGAPVAVKPVK
ncbi:MAG TPA: hypothetical protein VGI47_06245 [Candidatus Binataceae bacterium]|jgi:hypothetical protein